MVRTTLIAVLGEVLGHLLHWGLLLADDDGVALHRAVPSFEDVCLLLAVCHQLVVLLQRTNTDSVARLLLHVWPERFWILLGVLGQLPFIVHLGIFDSNFHFLLVIIIGLELLKVILGSEVLIFHILLFFLIILLTFLVIHHGLLPFLLLFKLLLLCLRSP